MRINSITSTNESIESLSDEMIVIGHIENSKSNPSIDNYSSQINNRLTNAIQVEEFKGKSGKTVMVYGNDDIKRILVYGLGKQDKLDTDSLRSQAAKISRQANNLKLNSITVDAASFQLDNSDNLQAFTEGLVLGSYEFLEYKSKKKNENTLGMVTINGKVNQSYIDTGFVLAEAVGLSRDVGNHPANILTPTMLADEVKKLSSSNSFNYSCYDVSEFEKMGLGSFYGVARGAKEPAKFIISEYKGGGDEKPIALVGKGLTFDSGGISLKPGARMDEMKFDMCGSATVLGVLKAVSELKPKLNIIFAIGSTENMPGGDAQRPGDIVTAYNGKTIEILNTDAEGRLVLADVLAYVVDKFEPNAILDFATLTGAVLVALGDKATGIMSNNDELVEEVKLASEITGERVWELPMWDDYSKDIKSKIADIKNLGKPRLAGTIAGGVFLKEFVDETPWVHMDIAGTAWGPTEPAYLPKNGATGVGVRMVYNLLQKRAN